MFEDIAVQDLKVGMRVMLFNKESLIVRDPALNKFGQTIVRFLETHAPAPYLVVSTLIVPPTTRIYLIEG